MANVNKNHFEANHTFFLNTSGVECVDYCVITNPCDFLAFNWDIPFKYTVFNPKKQLNKICDFITEYSNELNYDWYIKTRSDLELHSSLDFNCMSDIAINARARVYEGPRQLKLSASCSLDTYNPFGGKSFSYSKTESKCVLDDMIYVFSSKVIRLNAFNSLPGEYNHLRHHEWTHNQLWESRGVAKNIISIDATMRWHKSHDIITI